MTRKTQQSMPRKSVGNSGKGYLLAGGSMLVLFGALMDLPGFFHAPAAAPSNVCEGIVQDQVRLSRDQLSQILAISERASKAAVRSIVSAPYCRLPAIQIRAGVPAEREAYPLEFDPQTWFILLYEGEEYAGFDFVFTQ
jgi:hypothetical protein